MRRHAGRATGSGAARLTVLLVANGAATRVAAECWLRDDGSEICAPEPLEWRLAWWFWFAALAFILVFVRCGDRVCCCYRVRNGKEKEKAGEQERDEDEGDDEGADPVVIVKDPALIEPLLPQPMGKAQPQQANSKKPGMRCCKPQTPARHMIKPVYRYLDP